MATLLLAVSPAAAGIPAVAPAGPGAIRVATPRGALVEIIEERPPGAGPFPAVVLASGAGYHMRQPILERVARALVGAGIGVFRFDWAYRVRDPVNGKYSPDRATEVEDLNTVLALARKSAWVDPARIAVAGKSLGSLVGWQVLRADPAVRGALLLTPVCTPKPEGPKLPEANYPAVALERRPTAWILGKTDPVCTPAVLYEHLAHAGGSAQIDVVRGDHAFQEGGPATSPANERTLDLVVRLSVDFATALLAKQGAETSGAASAGAATGSGANGGAGVPADPRVFEYARHGAAPLHLHVFTPPAPAAPPTGTAPAADAGLVMFHSGGWTRGSPRWLFDPARRFAAAGLVAIAVEYRLSAAEVTPVEAFDDTCQALRWVRAHAGELGIDPKRIAGYGISAGGVMVAAAATAGCATAEPRAGAGAGARTTELAPNALLLVSTGFDLQRSETFRTLARAGVDAADYSPLAHVGAAVPPALIVHGDADSVTPLDGARAFCARSRAAGRACELQVYPGLGHLLTRNLADQRTAATPDAAAAADALDRQIRFLATLGFTRR